MSTQPRVHVLWAEFPVEPRVDTQAIGPMMGDDALSGVSTRIKTRQAENVIKPVPNNSKSADFVALLALSLLRWRFATVLKYDIASLAALAALKCIQSLTILSCLMHSATCSIHGVEKLV